MTSKCLSASQSAYGSMSGRGRKVQKGSNPECDENQGREMGAWAGTPGWEAGRAPQRPRGGG